MPEESQVVGKRRRSPRRPSRSTSTAIRHAIGKVCLAAVMLFLVYVGIGLLRVGNLAGVAVVASLMLALGALAYFSASRRRGGSGRAPNRRAR